MEWISGSIFIRPMGGEEGLQPGQMITGHTHNFDHTSIFFNGIWRARKWQPIVSNDGDPTGEWLLVKEFEREGPFHLLIEAGAWHEFTFLRDPSGLPGRAWCVYSHRTPQGEVSLAATGWEAAYR